MKTLHHLSFSKLAGAHNILTANQKKTPEQGLQIFFLRLPSEFLLGHYRVGSGMNLCDSYEVSIKIVNSA